MKKVKGINIWPEAVDDVLFAFAEVDEYRVVLTSDATEADVATVRVMPGRELSAAERDNFTRALGRRLRDRIGIRFEVEVVAAGSLARSEWKARRWVDERVHRL
jgi:phenylacetate-CoA ligase